MARFVPNNGITRDLTQGVPSPITEDITSITSKALRLKILYDREYRGFEKVEVKGPRDGFETSGLPIFETEKLKREKKFYERQMEQPQYEGVPRDAYVSQPVRPTLYDGRDVINRNNIVDSISLVDIDFKPEDQSSRGYRKMIFPFVPRELSYSPESRFVGIATMGRNTPFFQFTGSEDTLNLEIDWFSSQLDRQDVINSCRWVESLSKSNGYDDPPHRVKLVWGEDDILFRDFIWLVVSAPYISSDFVKAYRDPSSGEIVRVGMLPQQALQKITLKRISSHNLRTEDFMGSNFMNNNNGR